MDRYFEALEAFINAAVELNAAWEQIEKDKSDDLSKDYPFQMDFGMLVNQIIDLRDALHANLK